VQIKSPLLAPVFRSRREMDQQDKKILTCGFGGGGSTVASEDLGRGFLASSCKYGEARVERLQFCVVVLEVAPRSEKMSCANCGIWLRSKEYRTPALFGEVLQQIKRSSCMLVESLALHDIFVFRSMRKRKIK
jgi:hypothetical protein